MNCSAFCLLDYPGKQPLLFVDYPSTFTLKTAIQFLKKKVVGNPVIFHDAAPGRGRMFAEK